jgi:DNA-binding CsgD family transcriptional regulator
VYLAYRPLEAADLEPCLALVSEEYVENADIYPDVPRLWQTLLTAGMLNGMVLEDLTRPPGERLASFGASVFVTPEFTAEVRRGETPGPAALLARHLLAGESPVLTPAEIRWANSGPGLHLLVLHYAEASGLFTHEQVQCIHSKQVESFFYVHGGYRFEEMLVEHRDPVLCQFALESGFRLRSDYAAYYQTHTSLPEVRPLLMGITREETLPHPGLHVSRLFLYTSPRFHFKPREQALLLRALLDETDAEIAAALGISPPAVKKRWNGIYERVAETTPVLFPECAEGHPAQRGQEKRRHLLRYLRLHPEELRPVEGPKREA